MKRKIIPMLMICNSVLETYIGTFFPYISGRNYAPNVGHSQPSSQLCANSAERRSGTTLKIQRNFTISFTTQSQKDLIFIKHLSYGSRMNMTAVTASNVMLQLFCNFATQKMFTASNCFIVLKNPRKSLIFHYSECFQFCNFLYLFLSILKVLVIIFFLFLNTFTFAFLQQLVPN